MGIQQDDGSAIEDEAHDIRQCTPRADDGAA